MNNKIENYYVINQNYSNDFSEFSYVSRMIKTSENVYISGTSDGTYNHQEYFYIVDTMSGDMKILNSGDLFKNEYVDVISMFVLDNYIFLRYNDISGANKIGIWNAGTYEFINGTTLSREEGLVDCFINSDGNLELIINVMNQYGSAVKSKIFNTDTHKFDEGREYGFQRSLMFKIFPCRDSAETILANINPDESGESVSLTINKYSITTDIVYSTKEYVYSNDHFRGIFMNLTGNICVAYKNNNDILNIDEYDEATGELIASYELDVMTDCSVVQGVSEKYDIIIHDSEGIYGYNILNGDKEKIFSFEYAETDNLIYTFGNRVSVCSTIDEYRNENIVLKMTSEGDVIDKITLSSLTDNIIQRIDAIGSDILCLEKDNIEDIYYINKYDSWNTSFSVLDIAADGKDIDFCLDADGNMYVFSIDSDSSVLEIIVYSFEGEKLFQYKSDDCFWFDEAVKCSDDGIIFSYYNSEKKVIISKLTFSSQQVTNIFEYNVDDSNDFRIYQGDNMMDFYYQTYEGVFGYDISGNIHEIINWIDSDLYFENPYICVLSNDSIIVYAHNIDTQVTDIYNLIKADERIINEIKNREEIIIGGYDIFSTDLYEAIKAYNKSNSKYHLKVMDYSLNDAMIDLNSSVSVVQNIPDILIGNAEHEFFLYDYCIDLSSFVKEDLVSGKYIDNIINIYRNENGTFKIPISFDVVSFECSDENAIYNDIESFIEYSGLSGNTIRYSNSAELSDKIIMNNICSFIDYDNFKCNFDNKEFCILLNYLKELKNNEYVNFIPYSDVFSICDFKSIVELENELCHKPAFNGIPGYSTCENIMIPGITVSISEKCKNKSEAWNFIKSLYSKQFQDNLNEKYPVLKESFMSKIKDSQSDLFSLYGGVSKNSLGDIYEFETMKNEYIQEVLLPKIQSVSKYRLNDKYVEKIIIDEIGSFFEESYKEAEEVSVSIQNKISLYLNEVE
ncbi:MAG: hypothetical protein J6A58_13610 [Oscillospiraceae bacterium]|nr:hypothetical protein [Oscillospiraceae bacterium]